MDTDLAPAFLSPLDRWLWANRKTGKALADQIGVHESTVSRIRRGDKSQAGDAVLEMIKEVTGLKRL